MLRNKMALAILFVFGILFFMGGEQFLDAKENKKISNEVSSVSAPQVNARELLRASGVFGVLLLVLSLAMVALILEHLMTLRRKVLIPTDLIDKTGQLINKKRFSEAAQLCRDSKSMLGEVLYSGLVEAGAGYSAVIKAMEDSCSQISSRMLRKLQYLNVIGTIAPMIGLLGTVWGLMLAFMEFTNKANPQVSELAPGIYKALVTTLMGLSVAVPALAAFAIFQNWIDELVADTALTGEHLFTSYKKDERQAIRPNENKKTLVPEEKAEREQPTQRIPPVVREKGNDE